MGVESISGVRMVGGAHDEGNKGIELSVRLLCGQVRVKLFMNVLDEDSKGRPCWRWNSKWKELVFRSLNFGRRQSMRVIKGLRDVNAVVHHLRENGDFMLLR